jgi:hypothetical protein
MYLQLLLNSSWTSGSEIVAYCSKQERRCCNHYWECIKHNVPFRRVDQSFTPEKISTHCPHTRDCYGLKPWTSTLTDASAQPVKQKNYVNCGIFPQDQKLVRGWELQNKDPASSPQTFKRAPLLKNDVANWGASFQQAILNLHNRCLSSNYCGFMSLASPPGPATALAEASALEKPPETALAWKPVVASSVRIQRKLYPL